MQWLNGRPLFLLPWPLRVFSSRGFSGSAVHQLCDVVEPGLRGISEVSSIRRKLAQKHVGVFVRSALPWRIRVAEPDVDLQVSLQFGMAGHLRPAIIGHKATHLAQHVFDLPIEGLERGGRRVAVCNKHFPSDWTSLPHFPRVK